MDLIKNSLAEAQQVLADFLQDKNNVLNIEAAGKLLVAAFQKGHKVISCGNGGSMCDAMHFAEELTGRFREDRKPLQAVAIADASHITCTGNDFGFDKIFSRYVEAMGRKGDVLLAISTSGNSANVLDAARAAKQLGINVIALTGKDGGKLKDECDVEIRAPFSKYSDRVQEIHIKVIHCLIEYVEAAMKN